LFALTLLALTWRSLSGRLVPLSLVLAALLIRLAALLS
jgi:hypothetical protein